MENIHSKPQWHLLGAGSLGCLFAACLHRAGVALELIVRDDIALQQLRANGGITLSYKNSSHRDERTTIAVTATTPKHVSTPITQLLICTKAQQTLEALASIKTHLAPNVFIVLLQNGMGVRELLQSALLHYERPHAIILNALSTEGAFRGARFDVTHAGHGETLIGAIEPQQQVFAESAVQALQCELPIVFAPDIERRLWLKLGVNSVINPLTAIHRCRNGELLKLDNIETIVMQLCEELTRVAHFEHIEVGMAQLRDEIFRVIRATANNKSSMLQDVEAGRATEIDYINGFIVQRAQQHRIECTQHARLLAAIHTLASN